MTQGLLFRKIFVAEPPLFAATIQGIVHFRETTGKCFKDLSKKLQDRAERVTARAHIEYGRTIETIAEYVHEHDVDLLVIGAIGRSNAFKRLKGNGGSTAHNLARRAPCTVLMVK